MTEECGNDPNKPFKLTRNLMGSGTSVNLTRFTLAELLAEKFSNVSRMKAIGIQNNINFDSSGDNSNMATNKEASW